MQDKSLLFARQNSGRVQNNLAGLFFFFSAFLPEMTMAVFGVALFVELGRSKFAMIGNAGARGR